MMNLTKFSSPNLDTPKSRYQFFRFASKSVKINKENQISNQAQQLGAPGLVHPEAPVAGPHDQRVPHVSGTGAERGV